MTARLKCRRRSPAPMGSQEGVMEAGRTAVTGRWWEEVNQNQFPVKLWPAAFCLLRFSSTKQWLKKTRASRTRISDGGDTAGQKMKVMPREMSLVGGVSFVRMGGENHFHVRMEHVTVEHSDHIWSFPVSGKNSLVLVSDVNAVACPALCSVPFRFVPRPSLYDLWSSRACRSPSAAHLLPFCTPECNTGSQAVNIRKQQICSTTHVYCRWWNVTAVFSRVSHTYTTQQTALLNYKSAMTQQCCIHAKHQRGLHHQLQLHHIFICCLLW